MAEGHQREDVGSKYETLYGGVAEVIKLYIRHSAADPEETYEGLRPTVNGYWALVSSKFAQQGPYSLNIAPGDGLPQVEETGTYIRDYFSEPKKWFDLGAERHGRMIDMIQAFDDRMASIIAERAANADLILDLGCGWGHRMVNVWRKGVQAQYYGGDRSPHSQACVGHLKGLLQNMKIDWFPFDFLNPDFSAIPKQFRRVAVFSCHAIEQVHALGPKLYDTLLAHFSDSDIVGIHLEPLAFQIDTSRTVEAGYASKKSYNLDCYDVVRTHRALKVEWAEAAIFDSRDSNPTSLLAWRKR